MTQSISMIQDTIIYIRFQENKKLKQIKRYFHIFHIQKRISLCTPKKQLFLFIICNLFLNFYFHHYKKVHSKKSYLTK